MGFQRPGSRSQHAFGVTFDGPKSKAAATENKDNEPSIPSRANAQLPVARCRRELLYLVEQHATVVVLGDTGSGKTTQIPQFLHEAGELGHNASRHYQHQLIVAVAGGLSSDKVFLCVLQLLP
ncbi:uncharacterized protein HaLaN_24445 [Haematococcus lacustris]|uniref:Uncharacterized protein n=1 Tax=Haematococcus lacustris TaxID=44745 RepID=A0A699ZWH4_HAELA|nr:uncharacterized protein HaLaN_24445 [Haematococcus lacustris]